MARTSGKNGWALFLLLLAGLVIGSFIGYLVRDVSFLSWMNYGKEFGLSQPLVLDLDAIKLTFAITIKINIASIIGVIISAFIYRII